MIALPEVLAAASNLQAFCSQNGWRFCFIGGVAIQRWGEPRTTQDVDITLLCGFGGEEPFVDKLLERFEARTPGARAFAIQHRVLLLRDTRGVGVDVALGALPFEERSIERATPWLLPTGSRIITCSAEDLVVHKSFAGRERDWGDVEQVLVRQGGRLNLELIRSELIPLLELKGELSLLAKLEELIRKTSRRLKPSRSTSDPPTPPSAK